MMSCLSIHLSIYLQSLEFSSFMSLFFIFVHLLARLEGHPEPKVNFYNLPNFHTYIDMENLPAFGSS